MRQHSILFKIFNGAALMNEVLLRTTKTWKRRSLLFILVIGRISKDLHDQKLFLKQVREQSRSMVARTPRREFISMLYGQNFKNCLVHHSSSCFSWTRVLGVEKKTNKYCTPQKWKCSIDLTRITQASERDWGSHQTDPHPTHFGVQINIVHGH